MGHFAGARGVAHVFQDMQKESEAALGVCGALDVEEEFVIDIADESLFDLFKAQDSSVMHKHDVSVGKRVAVCLSQDALGRCPDMAKHQSGLGALGKIVEVHVVPRGRNGLENAWNMVGAIVPDAKPIAIDGVSHIETEPRIKRLVDDGVCWFCEEVREHHGVAALVYHEAAHGAR